MLMILQVLINGAIMFFRINLWYSFCTKKDCKKFF